MADEPAPTYTFGDNPLAGDRLSLLAQVFEPTSAALLRRAAPDPPMVAVDLGCGPGFTTRLVADTTRAIHTVGLDQSVGFVERARAGARDRISFVVHDVTATPFPCGPPDLVFARYVLAHLPDPMTTAAAWSEVLSPGGRLVLDEIQDIAADEATFARYLDIVSRMMASRGGDLYVGRRLCDQNPFDLRGTTDSSTATIAPTSSVVARLFQMNLATWRSDPWVMETVDAADLERLHRELTALATDERVGAIVWTHRQVIYARDS